MVKLHIITKKKKKNRLHHQRKKKESKNERKINDMLHFHTINLNDNRGYMTDLVVVVEKLSSEMIRKLRVQTLMPAY